MINLTDTLQYDTSLTLEEQVAEVQQYISEQMKSESAKQHNANCGRLELETWIFDTHKIERKYNYLASDTAKNCYALANTEVTVINN